MSGKILSSSGNVINGSTYEDINDILKRLSNRTLEMKTNNVKLLNKIGSEMNNLLIKVQDIVRFCINDRNDFMKEIELIQFDFIELGKKIDEQFSQPIANNSKTTQSQFNRTNLQKMLNDSDQTEEESSPKIQSNKTSKKLSQPMPKISNHFDLVIPDTCYPIEVNEQQAGKIQPFIIRDTLDSNYEQVFMNNNNNNNQDNNHLDTINESIEKEISLTDKNKNFDETCLEEDNLDTETNLVQENKQNENINRLKYLKNSQSTPLAVKKKLQEHGLLDLTNSPHESPYKSPSIFTTNSNTNLNTKKQSQFNSPVKYIQSKFTIESPGGPSSSKTKTPVKIVLKTPTKSPSIIIKKPQFQYGNENNNNNNNNKQEEDNNQNDSLDFSFEFKKNSKQSNQTQLNIKSKSNDLNEDCASPKTQNQAKRFKQLTMTQVFMTQNDPTTKTKITNSNRANSKSNFDETCLSTNSTDLIKNQNLNLKKSINIKNEPNDFNSHQYSNSSNLRSFKVKDEPVSMIDSNYQDPVFNDEEYETELDNRPRRELANEYFNDFDKVPKKKNSNSPTYKHVQVVRKQDERKKLAASACKECENYWNSLPEEMRPKRMEDSCRHRSKYQAPPTPEHYWSIAFPNTQECIERGYGGIVAQSDKDDQAGKRPRRKRPLKLISTDKNNPNEDDIQDFDFGE